MFNIAICDDDKIDCNNIKNAIDHICLKSDKAYNIKLYQNPKHLISHIENKMDNFDLLLLDICMDVQNGIETAKVIRNTDEELQIIFITSSPDYVYSGYDVEAIGYLLKPFDINKLEKLFIKIWNKENMHKHIKIVNRGEIYNIAFNDILYLESNDKKVKIVTLKQEVTTYGKLSDFLKKLPKNYFISCHKSYIVNLKHVKCLSSNSFKITSLVKIPISRSYYKTAKNSFLRYLNF